MKTLAKEHGILSVNQATPASGVFTITVGNGWRPITGSTRAFISETYFDLAGMSQREKTLFIEAATVQEVAPAVLTAGAAGDGFLMADIMTSEPMTDVQALNFATQGNFAHVSCGLGFQETIFGRIELFAKDIDTATWPYPLRLSSNQLGSLQATASDRIYSYRVVNIDGNSAATDFAFSGVRHLINAVAKEEPDYQYLMRLRRSYELQQSHDED
jgi:hypothetical protein